MNPLHDAISSRLHDLQVGESFLAVHSGETIPLLTDYYVRRIPDSWNSTIPPDLVDGRNLTPLFLGCDSYSVYFADNDSNEIIEIDPEVPWPPTNLYPNWDGFVRGLYETMSVEKTEEAKSALGKALDLDL